MDRVDFLSDKLNDAPLYLIKFGDALNKDYKFIMCVEGNDEAYYSNICRIILNKFSFSFVRCGGRKNVISLLETLKNHKDKSYRESLHLGFIDKDYDVDFINAFPEKLYITPSYSFENFYVSIESFKSILSSYFHTKNFGDFEEDYERCINAFISVRNEFIRSILAIDTILRAVHIMEKKGIASSRKTYVSSIKINSFIIEINSLDANWSADVQDWLNNPLEYVDELSYEEAKKFYKDKTPDELVNHIRGKYLFDFFTRYLKKLLIDALNQENPIIFIRRKANKLANKARKKDDSPIEFYSINIHENFFDSALNSLATCATTPDCLVEFLNNAKIKAAL